MKSFALIFENGSCRCKILFSWVKRRYPSEVTKGTKFRTMVVPINPSGMNIEHFKITKKNTPTNPFGSSINIFNKIDIGSLIVTEIIKGRKTVTE